MPPKTTAKTAGVILLVLTAIVGSIVFTNKTDAAGERQAVIVSDETMQKIYDEIRTPYKYGVVLKGEAGRMLDSPGIFRSGDTWTMMYIIFDGAGYETALAESDDLLNWKPLGKILTTGRDGWDSRQAAGYVALQDYNWGGSYTLQTFNGKYWLSYLGGALHGYETEPLAIGIAWSEEPTKAIEWHRLPENPVLHREQADCRSFEGATLYKSHIIYDESETLGHPFVMFYNGKQKGEAIERIGMAVSDDMHRWRRYGASPVIDNDKGISGDPQIAKIGDVWVLFYFGAFWKPKAFDTFACSYDLVHWRTWQGANLVEPSEPWDEKYAHKPWVVKYKDVVYHFYCAVGDQGRVIALATSKDLKAAHHGVDR